MRSLPLYPTRDALMHGHDRMDIDPSCTRCELHDRATNPCMGAVGEPGGLLVIGEGPTKLEDRAGRAYTSDGGRLARAAVEKLWRGPAVFDYAVRCAGGREIKPKHVQACRPYLASVFDECKPTRVLLLGPVAALAFLGRAPSAFSTRRGYTFIDGVPVFLLMPPVLALRNRFLRTWWNEDIEWALTAQPEQPPFNGRVHLVEDAEDARQAARLLGSAESVAFDTETAGQMFSPSFRVICASFAAYGERDAYVWTQQAIADKRALAPMIDLLADESIGKVGANIKYDQNAVRAAWGAEIRNVVGDTRLMRKLLDADADASLATMSELVGMGGMKDEQHAAMDAVVSAVRKSLAASRKLAKIEAERTVNLAPGTKRVAPKKMPEPVPLTELGVPADLVALASDPDIEPEKWQFAVVKPEVTHRYNGRDAVATMALFEQLQPRLESTPMGRTWGAIVRDASDAVAQVEAWGVPCSRDRVLAFDSLLILRIDEARRTLDGYFRGVNWSSPDQVAEILYGKLRLPIDEKMRTETGKPSTDKEALEALRDRHPLVAALLDVRKAEKLRGTYAQGMLPHIRPDGRIHPSILLDGARSGRTSCAAPNLQNIPRPGTEMSKPARDCFAAEDGNVLLQIDYSQLELRVAAMLSGDPEMIRVFVEGIDFHQYTAETVSEVMFGVPPSQVTKEMRSRVKPLVFGKLYGKGDNAMAKDLHVTVPEARKIIDRIFGRFRVLDRWTQARLRESRLSGEAWTWWAGERARRRPLYQIADQDDGKRLVAEHSSYNTPIQGTASDFCVKSIVDTVRWIRETDAPARLCLPIHDALLIEVRKDAAEDVARAVKQIMESQPMAAEHHVPLVADVEIGEAWGSLSKFKL